MEERFKIENSNKTEKEEKNGSEAAGIHFVPLPARCRCHSGRQPVHGA
jgi:hypothetical protein